MLDAVTIGEKIRMTNAVTNDYPVNSTATVLYFRFPCTYTGTRR